MNLLFSILKDYLRKGSRRYVFLRVGIGLLREFKFFLGLLMPGASPGRLLVRFVARHEPNLKVVEYVGWLPIFRTFSDCGNHPQFELPSHSPGPYWAASKEL
jgi:hypothetical protein